MVLLRSDPDSLDALVATTADALGIDATFVEKDFWVIEVLRAATREVTVLAKDGREHPVQTIFKGGTSLSRAYGLIERFSEDVDLLVAFPTVELSIGARDKALKAIRDAVAAHLGAEFTAVASTTGVKRNIRYANPTRRTSSAVTEGVLLEMGSRGGTYPTQRHDLRSLVAEYAIGTLGDTETSWEEFLAVPASVLAPERTLLEKLALLHDGASRFPDGHARSKLLQGGRHLYDVHQLLGSESVLGALRTQGPAGVQALWSDIDEHSQEADFSFTPRPAAGFGGSPLLDNNSPWQSVGRQGYATAMDLVYGERPSFDDCIEIIRAHASLL
ncbi:MAG: nucleotidyl transferase AbiEii/AbiGii toxin family protein [Actinomycetota bacterium]|nr:nucleotidyl transferase AbiEii/AbiGii toxin family protein [Actinomycetota bacterium]MDQ2895967.1 nucleotidyl transferase AbiEii/AbiGii toxin family protein [Actinomycetota bacterium]